MDTEFRHLLVPFLYSKLEITYLFFSRTITALTTVSDMARYTKSRSHNSGFENNGGLDSNFLSFTELAGIRGSARRFCSFLVLQISYGYFSEKQYMNRPRAAILLVSLITSFWLVNTTGISSISFIGRGLTFTPLFDTRKSRNLLERTPKAHFSG